MGWYFYLSHTHGPSSSTGWAWNIKEAHPPKEKEGSSRERVGDWEYM